VIKSRLPLLTVALVAVASFAFVAGAVSAPPSYRAQEVDLELGKETYRSQCEPCHGDQGKGDGPAARFLETTPRDLTSGRWLYVEEATIEQVAWLYVEEATIEQVAGIVRDGIGDTEMEPFGDLLLEKEITAVAAYVVAEFASERP